MIIAALSDWDRICSLETSEGSKRVDSPGRTRIEKQPSGLEDISTILSAMAFASY